MGKDKIRRFRENETFPNLFQASFEEVYRKDYALKGAWNEKVFGNKNPLVLELGCGKGEYTLALARLNKSVNYIGVDVKGARLWRGAKTALEEKLDNVAFIRTRIELIESFFAPGEVSQIWITFPDPQPRKENKRLTSPRFLNRYLLFLAPDAVIHLKQTAGNCMIIPGKWWRPNRVSLCWKQILIFTATKKGWLTIRY